jgi:hypothetical protein
MIIFTLAGLALACLFFVVVGLAGLFHALFNDIGGNGSRTSALCGLAVCAAGFYGAGWVWTFSPLTIVVAP